MSFIVNPYSFGFTPLSLSPALWLSDTGSDPSVWPDLSGNGRNATQADVARRPAITAGGLNGRQVRRFDGVDDGMIFGAGLPTGNTAHTAFIVGTRTAFTNQAFLSWGALAINNSRAIFANVNFNIFSSFYSNDRGWGAFASNANLITWRYTGSEEQVWQNSGSLGSRSVTGVNTSSSTAANFIGSYTDGSFTAPLKGDIAEILVFPRALSTTDRQNVESYLRNKWATP